MRPRVAVVVIAVILLAVLALILTRRAGKPEPARPGAPAKKSARIPSPNPRPVDLHQPDADSAIVKENPDPVAAKRALAKALGAMSLDRIQQWAQDLEAMHGGACPEFREFARAFLAAAGPDVVPIVKSLLAECGSDEAKFLLAAVLGESRNPAALPLLKELAKDTGTLTTSSALYAVGMARTPEGLEFLKSWLKTSRRHALKDLNALLGPALAAIGQHGIESFDTMVEEARQRTTGAIPTKAQVLGYIRGASAIEGLRKILETDNDRGMKYGAALALGSSIDSTALELLAGHSDPLLAAAGLLAPRRIPDVWNATAPQRAELAERYLVANGIPSGDARKDAACMTLAMLLPPQVARPLYESITSSPPGSGGSEWLASFIAAFGDQSDIGEWVVELSKRMNLSAAQIRGSIEAGIQRGALPGRATGGSSLVMELLTAVRNPETNLSPVRKGKELMPVPTHTLSAVMRSGIAASTLSTSLGEAWNQMPAPDAKSMLVQAALQGAYPGPASESLQWTYPEDFLAQVVREAPNASTRQDAAYAYLVAGHPINPDPAAMRAVSDMIAANDWDFTSRPTSVRIIAPVIGSYYARWGSAADLERLRALPYSFPVPEKWTPQQAEIFRKELAREMQRTIDAIKLSGN